MSETKKANTVAFHKKVVFGGDVENAFSMYAGAVYRQHNHPADPGEGCKQQHDVLIR